MRSKTLLLAAALLLVSPSFAESDTTTFSRAAVLDDLAYLHDSLAEAHYDAFAYVTREELAAVHARVRESVTEETFSLLEATNTLQRLITAIDNGHTEISFPGGAYREYAYAGGTVFPLEVALEDGKALVRKNFSTDEGVAIGAELVSIDGEPLDDVLARLSPHISAERPYFRNAKIELYSLPRLYWQVYGQRDEFSVEIRTDDTMRKYVLPAVSLIDGYEMKRTEVVDARMTLTFIDSVAYLDPGPFGGDENAYRAFIDDAFGQILERGAATLIIDLRNNPGGNDSFSDYLVSYIADEPFRWYSTFSLKTSRLLKAHTRANGDPASAYSKAILAREDGEVFDYEFDPYTPQPEKNRFIGRVYVLINRQSHSQAAVTAAQIQDYGFGTLVGEETGEYPSLYASQFQYRLPNTGIEVKVSKGRIVRVSGSEKQEGVIPEIAIRDRLLDDTDEILDGLLERLNTER